MQTELCTLGHVLGSTEKAQLIAKSDSPALSTPIRDLTVNQLRNLICIIAAPPFKKCSPAQAITIIYNRAEKQNLII